MRGKIPSSANDKIKRRRKDSRQRVNFTEFRACIDVNSRSGQHPNLADKEKSEGLNGGESHDKIDHKERKNWKESEGEKIKGSIFFDTIINGSKSISKFFLNRFS